MTTHKKLTLSILLVLTGLAGLDSGGMAWGATRKVQYVDTDVVGGAGDGSSWANAYSGLYTWEAQNTNLVAAGKYLDVYCRGNTVDAPGYIPLIDWTTSATCYISIHMDPNNYHNGVWNDSLYTLAPVGQISSRAVYITQQYVTLDGLQIRDNGTSSYTVSLDTSSITVKNCIIKDSSNSGILVLNYAACQVYNNIIYNCTTAGIYSASGNNPFIYNNTVSGCGKGFYLTTSAGNTYTIKNNLLGANTADYATTGAGATITSAANYTSDATSPNNGIYDNATITFAGAADFHLAASMSGTLLGTDLSGTFTTDIDGDTRASWYAGADELISSSNVINWWHRRRQGLHHEPLNLIPLRQSIDLPATTTAGKLSERAAT